MSATYSNKSRQRREPHSPQTIVARIFALIFLLFLGVVIFLYPWLFTYGGR